MGQFMRVIISNREKLHRSVTNYISLDTVHVDITVRRPRN